MVWDKIARRANHEELVAVWENRSDAALLEEITNLTFRVDAGTRRVHQETEHLARHADSLAFLRRMMRARRKEQGTPK